MITAALEVEAFGTLIDDVVAAPAAVGPPAAEVVGGEDETLFDPDAMPSSMA